MVRLSLILAGAIAASGLVYSQEPRQLVQDDDDSREFKEPELAKELKFRFQSDQAVRQEMIDFTVKHKLIGTVEIFDSFTRRTESQLGGFHEVPSAAVSTSN